MPTLSHCAIALIGAAILIAIPETAPSAQTLAQPLAQAQPEATVLLVARKKRARRARHQRGDYGRYIICTPSGCGPAPPGCVPTPGFDLWGNPTGYDVCR